jgi:hypothetical protein
MNEKVSKDRLYFEERKRGRALEIKKELAGQLKITEKWRQQKKV